MALLVTSVDGAVARLAAEDDSATVVGASVAVADPVANDDAYTVVENQVLFVPDPGVHPFLSVLDNDTDADGDPLTVVLVSGPVELGSGVPTGLLTLLVDGRLDYTPPGNFVGTVTFTYKVNDGGSDSNVATVTITVTAAPNTALVTMPDVYTTNEDTALVVPNAGSPPLNGLLNNDIDPDGDPLEVTLESGPTHGTLTLNRDPTGTFLDGSFTYHPKLDFFGTDSFFYQASDGIVSTSGVVTITVVPVNDAPVANDVSGAIDEDSSGVFDLLQNTSDADPDALTVAVLAAPSSGVVEPIEPAETGLIRYVPQPDFFGTDSFTYVAHDGTVNSNVATVSITVNPVNDAPRAVNDLYETDEDTILSAAGVLGNDVDGDSANLTAILHDGPEDGGVSGFDSKTGSFTYTPDPNFSGTDSFEYYASDGALDSNIATISIKVNPATHTHCFG